MEPERESNVEENVDDIGHPEEPEMPTLDEYLREEAPEVLENTTRESNDGVEIALPGRPRTRQFTGTRQVRNRNIFNDDWDTSNYLASLLPMK